MTTPRTQSKGGRYPDDWDAISRRIRGRAGSVCQVCTVPNYAVGYRTASGMFVPASGTPRLDAAGRGMAEGRECWPFRVREIVQALNDRGDQDREGRRWFTIILTVAHLNHTPEDCRDRNLRALCQRCHFAYDAATNPRCRNAARPPQSPCVAPVATLGARSADGERQPL